MKQNSCPRPCNPWPEKFVPRQRCAKGGTAGLLYVAHDAEDLHAHLNTAEMAFNTLGEKALCPGAGILEKINAGRR